MLGGALCPALLSVVSGRASNRRDDAVAILLAALAHADAGACVRRALRRHGATLRIADDELPVPNRVHVVAVGKAAVGMAGAALECLDGVPGDRLVVVPHAAPVGSLQSVVQAAHPLPDVHSQVAARRAGALVDGAGAGDLVLVLLSGGASSLLGDIAEGIDLDSLRDTTHTLMRAGASVQETNTVRKHLGALKGGLMAARAWPAAVVTLVLSDVVGSPMSAIASGPTVGDPTTFQDCLEIVRRFDVERGLPACVRHRLRAGAAGRVDETPKPGSPRLSRARAVMVGDNRLALEGAAIEAARRGYRVKRLTDSMVGDARAAGRCLAAVVSRHARRRPLRGDLCLLAGGETTVVVRGGGRGGRNQELVLAAVPDLDGVDDVCFASLGSDGIDGTSGAAGAWVDGTTARRATALGVSVQAHLEDNDSHAFFARLGDAIVTGPTGTNVMDLQVMLVGAR